ncbi:MAG: ABC transporter permease [Imperialibacter sp.]|uniref:ABC transporter permease n=1 Tax=Imperialibacter sp. TaxID=2038411 RepID=UPI0032EECD9E
MNYPKHISPPSWPARLLRWFVKDDYLEEIEGDMAERFYDNIDTYGISKAKRLYVVDICKLLRPILMKKWEGDTRLNHYGMLRNYFITSLRTIKRNALFSAINVTGLAISMSVGILMILFLSEIYSFDQFHEKKDSIYRITSAQVFMGDLHQVATSSVFMADEIKKQVPGVEEVAIMRRGLSAEVKTKNDFVRITGFYASPSFFDVFSFNLLEGNPRSVLSEPNQIVLTASVATKLFGEENPVGQTLELPGNAGRGSGTVRGTVTGVLEDPPIHSHIQFEVLVSLSTYQPAARPGMPPGGGADFRTNPGDFHSSFVYLTLNEQTSQQEAEALMGNIMKDFNAGLQDPITHRLQALSECATSDNYHNLPGPSFSRRKVYFMIGLTCIVLFSACFNYANLSLARSLRRTKEVGVRKVTGATRSQIFAQFIVEAILISFAAFVLGLLLFFILRPGFLNLPNPTSQDRTMFLLTIGYKHIILFLLFALLTGGIAGFLPALFLSKMKALQAFRQGDKTKVFSGIYLRRGLTVVQFMLSIGLIMCAVLIRNQYEYAMNYELGYDTGNIVNVGVKGSYADELENSYVAIPGVEETSRSKRTLGYSTVFATAEPEDRSQKIRFLVNEIDHKYLDMHGFNLLAGSNFQPLSEGGEEPNQIIINEEFLKVLALGTPDEAIGRYVWYNNRQLMITGVVEDFITTSLVWEIDKKFAFIQHRLAEDGVLGVKIGGNDIFGTLQKLEEAFTAIDPNHPFEAEFYDDQIAINYRDYQSTYKIISFLAFLAISISTLGLLGMAVYTVETRMKEICIRKVLGAASGHLMLLLSKNFLVMLILAAIVAVPVTVYLVDHFILSEFLYRAEIGLVEILSGFALVLFAGLLTVGWQMRSAVVQNPADALRNE